MRGGSPNTARRLNYILSVVILLLLIYIFTLQRAPEEALAPTQIAETAEIEPTALPTPPTVTEGCQILFVDSDGDGYGTTEAEDELCEDDELPLGLATQGEDCDDFNSSVWRSVEVYEDRDKDGFSSDKVGTVCSNNQAPPGTISGKSDPVDCDDRSAIVYPGSDWNETAGSPDYDCDGNRDLPVGSIFVTSKKYNGILGGLIGADAKCAENALSSDGLPLTGTWIAIISTSTTDAIDRLPDVELVDGYGEFISNATDFADQSIQITIEIDEMGEPTSANVWTGTGVDGRFSTELGKEMSTCNDWSAIVARGIYGSTRTTTNTEWLNQADSTCSEGHALYCVRIS